MAPEEKTNDSLGVLKKFYSIVAPEAWTMSFHF